MAVFRRAVIAVLLMASGGIASAEDYALSSPAGPMISTVTTETTAFNKEFHGELERIVAGHRGRMGLCVRHGETGDIMISINGDQLFPTASTIKVAVMCAAFDEMSKPDGIFPDYYATRPYDEATSTGGAGFIQRFKDGTPVELKELLHLMVTVSDNIATNMLVEWMGGLDRINACLLKQGFQNTTMTATIGGRIKLSEEMRAKWGIGVTTPEEMSRLMAMIAMGEAGSTTATDEMLRLLGHQYFDGGIAGQAPPMVWVGSKGGAVNRSRSDNAIVASPGGTYVLSVYTAENEDTRWTHENEGEQAIRAAARAVYKAFNPKSEWERPEGAEKL